MWIWRGVFFSFIFVRTIFKPFPSSLDRYGAGIATLLPSNGKRTAV